VTEQVLEGWLLRIEAATGDLAGLETIRDELAAAPGLDDDERESLLGRAATYLGDLEGGNQVWWGDATPPLGFDAATEVGGTTHRPPREA
jgi:hypothetical protein